MTNKRISAKSIIAIYIDDFEITGDVKELKWLRWIMEAYRKCQATPDLKQFHIPITIKNHRGVIPCNYVSTDQVEYNGCGIPYNTSTVVTTERNVAPAYILDHPYIVTTFKTGTITLHYRGVVEDEEGYMLIPDDEDLKMAIINWFLFKDARVLWAQRKISYNEYLGFQNEFGIYANKYRADHIPSPDKLQAIVNSYVRLLPNANRHAELFQEQYTQDAETFDNGTY